MLSNVRQHLGEITGSVTATAGAGTALASWQAQFAWSVTVMAGLVAIISGALTIRSILRREADAAKPDAKR